MPRRHGVGRGTRIGQRGVQSGVTWATIPSGVTIDRNGIDVGQGTKMVWRTATVDNASSGVSRGTGGASNVLTFATGLTTVTSFQGSLLTIAAKNAAIGAGVSPHWSWYAEAGGVTVYTFSDGTPTKIFYSGVSLNYLVFGT